MSNQPSSHLVSISHDPLEEGSTAGLDQDVYRAPRGAGRRFAGGPVSTMSRSLRGGVESLTPGDWRPVLLAGAIGLFAAWAVSGMGRRSGERRFSSQRDDWRGASRDWSRGASSGVGGPMPGYDRAGPEGRSSAHDFELDAMNP